MYKGRNFAFEIGTCNLVVPVFVLVRARARGTRDISSSLPLLNQPPFAHSSSPFSVTLAPTYTGPQPVCACTPPSPASTQASSKNLLPSLSLFLSLICTSYAPAPLPLAPCLTSPPLLMATSITHWLRRAPLGSGSFGTVSLAIDLDSGDYFAVKSIQSAGSAPEQCALQTELAILQSLHSPRIVSCLGADFSADGDAPACNLFLEYVDGGSIAELIKKSGGRLDEARAQCFTRAIVEGLAYLHEQSIVHCDIKGRNVLVGSGGVKIADFGAAKKLAAKSPKQEFKGTPLWMAPEVVRGEEQGCASDIWSLGCTVVEMLQGRSPWEECSPDSSKVPALAAALFRIGYSSEESPLPEASSECRDFLRKALHRDPKLRWTAAQLLDHPWLRGAKSVDSYCEQQSPRSTLDFLASDSEADGDHDSWGAISPIHHSPSVAVQNGSCPGIHGPRDLQERSALHSHLENLCIPNEGLDWISVRCSNEEPMCRQKPFMQKQIGVQLLQPGEKANLKALAFLNRNRSAASAQNSPRQGSR